MELSRAMVAEMNSGGMLTVVLRKSRTSPRILLVGATRSSCSLSQEMGSCLRAVLDSPISMKMALMLAAIACPKRRVSATSR